MNPLRIFALSCLLAVAISAAAGGQGEPNDSIISDSAGAFHPRAEYVFAEPLSRPTFQYPMSDTLWTSYVTNSRVHLIRLSDTDTLVVARRSELIPVLESLGINFGVWGWDHFVTDRHWADINGRTVSRNLKHDFVLDTDSYSGNQFSHPFHGSMFYNAARYHGHNYYSSALYPLVGSMVWEYFCETNLPSYNDFLSTGFGGTAIGEATFRTSDIVFDNSKRGFPRVVRELVGSLLNPTRGLHRLLSGESWRVTPQRGKREVPQPFSLDVSFGNRHMRELRHLRRSKDVQYISFELNYGDHFWLNHQQRPFDFFQLYALLNTTSGNPTFSDVDISGRIYGRQFENRHGWATDVALYQNFRYLDNYGEKTRQNAGDYALLCEAASFGVGNYVRKVGRTFSFSNDFRLNGVGFGANGTDYNTRRRYNFASGFSIRNKILFAWNAHLSIGQDFYFSRLYTPKGSTDPRHLGDYDWGDRGHASTFLVRNFLQVNVWSSMKVYCEYQYYYRRSCYYDFADVHAKSSELRLGLVYSI